jgi:hypothetical protein
MPRSYNARIARARKSVSPKGVFFLKLSDILNVPSDLILDSANTLERQRPNEMNYEPGRLAA